MHRIHLFAALLLCAGLWIATAAPVDQLEFQSDVVTQDEIRSGQASLTRIRLRGMAVFSTPFTKAVGFGDGPMDPADPTSPGGRPTFENNGLHLRVNGLDGQTCMECHSVLSALTVPFKFGLGGAGGNNANAMAMVKHIDVADAAGNGFADLDGRFINPPFAFGAGGVELLGKEMTADLQRIAGNAKNSPGVWFRLATKGISFGQIRYEAGEYDATRVRGVDADLVVRPFGRKGEFFSVRDFDLGAMRFHFGMEPVESVGFGVDADGDGVVNELSDGDMSALSIFLTNLERPVEDPLSFEATEGRDLFHQAGCATCHVPRLITRSAALTYSFPEVPGDPSANVFYRARLDEATPAGFTRRGSGLVIPLYSDLKRHDMGPDLAETFESDIAAQFITARLWGIADTAPYLHDGRAHTLEDAILYHGGEGEFSRDAYAALPRVDQAKIIAFLMTLRTPEAPAADLLE